MRKKTRMNKGQEGFSLVEMLIASFTSAVLVTSAYWLWFTVTKINNQTATGIRNMSELTSDLRVITDHIREATDGEDGAYPLFAAEDDEIGIYTDVNGDNTPERVRYFLEGKQIKRGVVYAEGDPPNYNLANEQEIVIGERIENGTEPLFYYYNKDWPGDVTNNPLVVGSRLLNTRYVELTLKVGVEDVLGEMPEQITTSVMMRNLKDNY